MSGAEFCDGFNFLDHLLLSKPALFLYDVQGDGNGYEMQ